LKGDENPSNADGYTAETWVTYTKTDGSDPVTYRSKDNATIDLSTVKSVTVWGYNAPRTYQVEVYKPGTSGDLTQDGNVYYTNTSDGSVSHEVITAFYNQRLAGQDDNEEGSSKGSNAASEYLEKYGIVAYFGSDDSVTAPEEFTDKNYVFDGWYDADTHTKISSDRTYGYRVTTNLKLVAGYIEKPTGTVTSTPKVSVINNGVEPFLDANNQSRVRLTTVLNVYNNIDTETRNPIDSDDNIKKVSAIYVQLPVKDSDGNKITWYTSNPRNEENKKYNLEALGVDNHETDGALGREILDYLNSPDFKNNTAVKDSGTLTVTITDPDIDSKVISYTYSVTFTSGQDGIDYSSTTVLTNKNRVQFTLPMKADLYYGTEDSNGTKVAGSNSAIIAYAAIYYDKTDNNEDDGEWILSENHAEFIADVVKPKGDDQ